MHQPAQRFQSTLPYGSDAAKLAVLHFVAISIHAPLRERPSSQSSLWGQIYFNPRSLAGATEMHKAAREVIKFQFTLPCGSDALQVFSTALSVVISIHAPLRERPARTGTAGGIVKFQSTLPYGSDDTAMKKIAVMMRISIHAPLRERRFAGV